MIVLRAHLRLPKSSTIEKYRINWEGHEWKRLRKKMVFHSATSLKAFPPGWALIAWPSSFALLQFPNTLRPVALHRRQQLRHSHQVMRGCGQTKNPVLRRRPRKRVRCSPATPLIQLNTRSIKGVAG